MSSKTSAQKKTVQQNACCVYDFTSFDELEAYQVRTILSDICKKYCFQQEMGEATKRLHFQGRFSLKIKKRLGEVAKILHDKGLVKTHLTITSTANRDNNFYVLKEDTRVKGPFTDENEEQVTNDLRVIKELFPWQKKLIEVLTPEDLRIIDIVLDVGGCQGKSTLSKYLRVYHGARKIPYCDTYKDLMRMAYCVGPKKLYIIDLPRALEKSKSKLSQFFAGIEELKTGYAFDDRNHFKDRIFDRPRICVFTNSIPDLSLLSQDMWKFWTIQNNELVKYIPPKKASRRHMKLLANEPISDISEGSVSFNSSNDDLSDSPPGPHSSQPPRDSWRKAGH